MIQLGPTRFRVRISVRKVQFVHFERVLAFFVLFCARAVSEMLAATFSVIPLCHPFNFAQNSCKIRVCRAVKNSVDKFFTKVF